MRFVNLKQIFHFNKFDPIIKNFSHFFLGIKITCRGRFTRNQRASLFIYKRGSNKLSTFSSDIDYHACFAILKYGVGSLKIWINH